VITLFTIYRLGLGDLACILPGQTLASNPNSLWSLAFCRTSAAAVSIRALPFSGPQS